MRESSSGAQPMKQGKANVGERNGNGRTQILTNVCEKKVGGKMVVNK